MSPRRKGSIPKYYKIKAISRTSSKKKLKKHTNRIWCRRKVSLKELISNWSPPHSASSRSLLRCLPGTAPCCRGWLPSRSALSQRPTVSSTAVLCPGSANIFFCTPSVLPTRTPVFLLHATTHSVLPTLWRETSKRNHLPAPANHCPPPRVARCSY